MNRPRRRIVWLAAWCGLAGCSVAAAAEHEVLVVRLAYQGDDYVLREARVLDSPRPLRLRAEPGASFRYALLDAAGRTLAAHASADPRVLRTPLSAPGEPPAGHAEWRPESGELVLRLPYRSAGRALRLERTTPGRAKPGVRILELPAALGR